MVTLYKILACHMMGDYVLQVDHIAKTKGKNWWHLLSHCITYTVPFALAFGIDWRIAVLLVTHFTIDALKARYHAIGYVHDQIFHMIVAAALYFPIYRLLYIFQFID